MKICKLICIYVYVCVCTHIYVYAQDVAGGKGELAFELVNLNRIPTTVVASISQKSLYYSEVI